MSISRKDFHEATEGSNTAASNADNIQSLIDKLLSKKEAAEIKRNNDFVKMIKDMEIYFATVGKSMSGDSKALVDELKNLFDQSTKKGVTQFELTTMNKRLKGIMDVIEHSNTIVGDEMDYMKDIADKVGSQINEGRANNFVMRSIKDGISNLAQNSIDVNALAAGLLTDSPLVMFMTKTIGDFGKSLMDKRKEVKEEKRTRPAEKLNEYQDEAHSQRLRMLNMLDAVTKGEKFDDDPGDERDEVQKPKPEKVKRAPKKEEDDEPIILPYTGSGPQDPTEPQLVKVVDSDDSQAPRSIRDAYPLLDITPVVEEQKVTNTLLDRFVNFMIARSRDDEEQAMEQEAKDRQSLAQRVIPEGDKPEKKGMFSKMLSLIDDIPGLGVLVRRGAVAGRIVATAGTFITGTLIPSITTFIGNLVSLAAPILAGAALLTAATNMFTNFFDAEKALGKVDVSMPERVAAAIGGIMEGFGSVADFVFGLLGFETDYKKWWNENFTRPFAEFINNFSFDAMVGSVEEWIKSIPAWIDMKVQEGWNTLKEYSPFAFFKRGLDYISGMFTKYIDEIDVVDIIMGPVDEVFEYLNEKFDVVDKIKSILDSFDLTKKIENIKLAILDWIPDFLLTDDEKKSIKISRDQAEDKKVDDRQPEIASKPIQTEKPQLRLVQKQNIIPKNDEDARGDILDPKRDTNIISLDEKRTELNRRFEGVTEERKILARPMALNQQPDAIAAKEKRSNIENYDEIIRSNEEKTRKTIIAGGNGQSQQMPNITNNSNYAIAAFPYNQERGIRDLQKTFAA